MNDIIIPNFNNFICLIAKRVSKEEWYKFPARTKDIFYKNKDISKWAAKASTWEKMNFLQDLGFTSAVTVFPTNNLNISDIPGLSNYTIDIKSRIKSIEKQMENDMFCLCTRELGIYYFNMSANSNSKIYNHKLNHKHLKEANERGESAHASALAEETQESARETMLKFVLNLLMDIQRKTVEMSMQELTILFHLREYNDTGVKMEAIQNLFQGAVGTRMVQLYLAKLVKDGYLNKTGKRNIYFLSGQGLYFINDYCDRILQL